MQHRYNIFLIPAVLLLFLLSSCSKGEKRIPEKDMARIIGELYLADKYIDGIPEYRAQMDSIILYEAVTARHGYTYEEYSNSVKYYLQQGDALKKIYTLAKDMLNERKDEINAQINKERNLQRVFWAIDSANKKELQNLWKEPILRSAKWLVSYNNMKQGKSWRFTDTTTSDIPQNAIWWINNIRLQRTNLVDSLYPILTKDYTLALESASKPGNNVKINRAKAKSAKDTEIKDKGPIDNLSKDELAIEPIDEEVILEARKAQRKELPEKKMKVKEDIPLISGPKAK